MLKIAFLAFFLFTPYFASAGTLPGSAEDADRGCLPGEDCPRNESCTPEEVSVGGSCYKLATESQNECTVQEQCSNITGSVCSDGMCAGQKGLGAPCTTASECDPSKNLTCGSGRCSCAEGTAEAEGKCVVDEGPCIGGACRDNETSPCSRAADGKCECEEGFVPAEDGKSCLREAEELGGECSIGRQCERLNGTCEDGVCREESVSSVAIPAMAGSGTIASECAADGDCKNVENAICKESICQCRENFLQSEDQTRCLPLASKPGDPCQMDKQCSKINESTCIDGKCVVVAAAGMQTRKNGSGSFAASVGVTSCAFLAAASRAVFAH